jgi:hypothetical protein
VLCGVAAVVVLVAGAVGTDAASTVFETNVIRFTTFGCARPPVFACGRPTRFGTRGLWCRCAAPVGVDTAGKCKNPCTI